MIFAAACKGERAAPPAAGSNAGSAPTVAVRVDAGQADAAVACVPRGDLQLSTAEGLRICSDKTKACIAIDPKTGAARPIAHGETAQPELAWGALDVKDRKTVVCFKDRCRSPGRKVLALVDREKDDTPGDTTATVDLAAIAIPGGDSGPELWDLAKDRRIDLPPASPGQTLGSLRAIGKHIIGAWTSPPHERIYANDGKLVGDLGTERSQLAMLDDTRWVALTNDHMLHVVGDRQARVEIEPSVGYGDWQAGGAMTVLPDRTVAVVLERPGEASVVLVDPERGAVFARWPLTLCP